jgi:L-ribulokinase
MPLTLGLDFGTESVRALLVDLNGIERATAVVPYPHGQIIGNLPSSTEPLPNTHAFQHPLDWLEAAAQATRNAMESAAATPDSIIGIGVDFTSCTMLPTTANGTPLCLDPKFAGNPQAWPKLWKHHGAGTQAEHMTQIARQRGELFLSRYGGTIGLEWLFPKVLETTQTSPQIAEAAEIWLEAGDWLVWNLTGEPSSTPARSTCQAGYKGLWNEASGWPSAAYLDAVHPGFSSVLQKLVGNLTPPGVAAGHLTKSAATRFGLSPGTPVSAATIDAHAGVPGAGAADPGTLVMVMGTSSCHMLCSETFREIPGIAGVVENGILPGYHGYETGQAAVGDAFDWLRRLTGQPDFELLSTQAAKLPPGADGVRCLDWFNGCRTPRMDGTLRGSFTGLSLHHGPAHLHRALMEATACGVRWIVNLMRGAGVPVNHFIATGGLPHHDPFLIQLYADVMGENILVPPTRQGPALGAAILGALAAGAFPDVRSAIISMTSPGTTSARVFVPGKDSACYGLIYDEYRTLAETLHPS